MQNSLFEQNNSTEAPLAEKIRPQTLADVSGHEKILGEGSVLRRMIETDTYTSFILWGPPGSGKTTIARLIEKSTSHRFSSFSAVFSKIASVKALMQEAEQRRRFEQQSTLVFIDEIHRFNKSQQDAFLPWVESGAVVLIGATTENPSFEVIPALLSRCHLFVLDSLSEEQLLAIYRRAIPLLGKRLSFTDKALQILAERAGGDARRGLNDLELVAGNAEIGETIDAAQAMSLVTQRSSFYDKKGEEHYNLISAFQKSIRGSDPQAALYWAARMIEAGEDPLYLVRRLVRIASEDIGLADPNALVQAIAAREAVHFLGMPEAATALTQLVVYLATAPKSNAVETAWFAAKKDADNSGHLKTPMHIRNAPTKTMAELGYGQEYRYSHAYENNYSYQKYFPDSMEEKEYYTPSKFGFERDIAKRLEWWHGLKEKQLEEEKKK